MNKNKIIAVAKRDTRFTSHKKDTQETASAQDISITVTEKPVFGIKKTLESRLSDLAIIIASSGTVAATDFLFVGSGYSLDHPFEALAIGSGATLGTQVIDRNWGRVYTSLSTLLLSASPEVINFSNDGNLYNLISGTLTKVLMYGAGFAVVTIIECLINNPTSKNDNYSAAFDVEAEFSSEETANKVYSMFNEIILNGGDAVSKLRSKLSLPSKAGEHYRITANIVGTSEDLEHNLQPTIEEYISQQNPINYKVSEVISTESFDYDEEDTSATFQIKADYQSQDKAQKVYDFLSNIIEDGDGSIVGSGNSKLEAPCLQGESWRINAIIFGDSPDVKRIHPDIEKYIANSSPINFTVSNIVRTG